MLFTSGFRSMFCTTINCVIVIFCNIHGAHGIVTIYGPPDTDPDYITTPGQAMLGLEHDFIVQLNARDQSGGLIQPGTGILLSTGRHVLTAAHLASGAYEFEVRLDTPYQSLLTFADVNNSVHKHEFFVEALGPLHGYDLAIIELDRNFIDEANDNPVGFMISVPELIKRGTSFYDSQDLVGAEARFGGYGRQGDALTGIDFSIPSGVDKIVGKNTISAIDDDFAFMDNEQSNLWWDFDDIQQVAQFNHYNDDLGHGAEEVLPTFGDSGGPVLVEVDGEWLVTGVIAGRVDGANLGGSDFDNDLPGTVGEIGFGPNLNYFRMHDWIARIVWNQAYLAPTNNWNGTWDDTTAWANGTLPGAGEKAIVNFDIGGSVAINGPAASHTIESLEVGTGSGFKQLLLSAGGSLSMPGDITIDTNGSIVLEVGTLSVDTLVIQSTALVPQTPAPVDGYFIWSDVNELGASSLAVNRIEVGQGGRFVYDWADQATKTLSAPGGGKVDIDVLADGEAVFHWSTYHDIDDLSNSGTLSLGEFNAGNVLRASSFTQTSGGKLIAAVSAIGVDHVFSEGVVTLAGQIELELLGTLSSPALYSFISYTSRSGAFDEVLGFSDIGNGLWLALEYRPTALVGLTYILGDLDGDGFVGINDLNIVLSHWNQNVPAGSALDGDHSGDGFVGITDLNTILGNWNAGTPPGSAKTTSIPEPATLGLFGIGLGLMGYRRRRGGGSCQKSDDQVNQPIRRSRAMYRQTLTAATVSVAMLLSSADRAMAAITFELTPVDNSALLTGYTTYDMQVTTDTDWTAAAGLLELTTGSFYQHAQGADTGPPHPLLLSAYPELAFDTYVIGSIAGGAGDVGGDGFTFSAGELDVSWYNLIDGETGTTTIGRLTVTDDAVGDLSIMLTAGNNEEAIFTVPLMAGVAQAPVFIGGGLASKTSSARDIELNYREMLERIFGPDVVDTRVFTPDNYVRWTFAGETPEPEKSLPEPGVVVLIGVGLAAAVMRRR